MTGKRILDWTRFSSDIKFDRFLPIFKNFAPQIHGNTLYENMKYYHDLGLETKLRVNCEDGFIPEYEYVPYENFTTGTWATAYSDKAQKRGPILFSLLKQHVIFGVYKISESNTRENARNQILIPLFDKILGLDSCATFLAFINRIDSEHISLEIFLFGVSDIDELVLYDMLSSPFLVNCRYDRIVPHNAMYWFYKFHIFIYHNPSILNGTACLITLYTKPGSSCAKLLNNNTADCEANGIFLIDYWGHALSVFEFDINDTFRDNMYSRYQEFSEFMQVGPDPESTVENPDYVIQFTPGLTSRNKWWGINKKSPYRLTELELQIWK